MIRGFGCIAAGISALLAVSAGGVAATQGDSGGSPVSPPGAQMTRPVAGAVISQLYGCTTFSAEPVDAACPGGHFHSGVDLAAANGTPVLAALPGTAHVVRSALGYGLHVILDHGGGLSTLYGHLSSVLVAEGDTAVAGDRIGDVGSTGNSTGPHLHFEVRRNGVPENPLLDVALP